MTRRARRGAGPDGTWLAARGLMAPSVRSWDALARTTAIVVSVAGLCGVVGHLAGIAALTQPFARGLPASLDAAVCLAVLGVSTLGALAAPRRARLAAAAGGAGVALYAGTMLVPHVSALLAGGDAPAGGIDVASAATLAAQGATLAILALRPTTRAPIAISSALTLGLAVVSLVAHSLDVPLLLAIGVEMPFLVAIALALHGAAVLGWAWYRDAAASGEPMPAWSPLVAAITAGGLFLLFTIAVEGDSALLQTALVLGAAGKLATTVHQHLRERRASAAAARHAQEARERAEATTAEAQEQRRWLEKVLDLAPVPLLLLDPASSRVQFANEAAKALARDDASAGPGAPAAGALAFVDPVGRELAPEQSPIERVCHGERLSAVDAAMRTSSGTREVVVDGALLRAMHGQPPVAVVALQDITELRRAQAITLRLGRLLDEAPTEVYAFAADTLKFVQENDAARRNLGWTSAELRQLGPMDLCPELDRASFLRAIEPLRTGERARVELETVHRRKDGTTYPVEMRIQISRSETPAIFFSLVENITARRRTEAERAEILAREREARADAESARERAAFLASASRQLAEPDDLAGTLRIAVRAPVPRLAELALLDLLAEGGTMRRAATSLGDAGPDRDLSDVVRDPATSAVLQRALRSDRAIVVDPLEPAQARAVLGLPGDDALEAARAHGVAACAVLALRARGRTLGALTLVSARPGRWDDEVERRLLDEYGARVALAIDDAQLFDEARAGLRAHEEFVEIAANDLRAPIHLVAMEAASVRRIARRGATLPSERVLRFADNVGRHAARISLLVDDLLEPSRVTGERVELSPEHVDLSTLVTNVVARFGERLASASSPFEITAPAVVDGLWDRLRLEQVVANLVSNAIKYGAGQKIEIEVRGTERDATLIVRDHGCGMTPEQVGRLFSLSERAVAARHYGGIGLGLYLVRRIVETMGGTIAVESAPGRGATFVVTLPRSREARSA